MKIEVMMFAAAKESVGSDRITLELEQPATSGSLMEQLGQIHPGLKPLLPSCRLAVDDQYVPDDFPLGSHHEIALIPPVSGG
ncbi:ThiS family protein [Rubripirellula obstinata]|uniref:Molybdopterin synthase sulfur carrier subunit n=1 Tax=Rubripirellula obstinata TaxID=406547 RepID=A0A5B1CPC0_9BACT|nr:MoaD/ThiS family protein [Rubripirellula obstinata]KAA1261699.1 ThiS family protein [Rubripirellula obstinata]